MLPGEVQANFKDQRKMATAGEAATRALYSALAEEAAAQEEARAKDVSQAVLQERSEKVNAEIAHYRELVDRKTETVKAARENVETKEMYLIALEHEVKAMEKKERTLEVQLRVEERKTYVEQWKRTEKDLHISVRKMRRLAYKVKSHHDIPCLEQELAQLTKYRDAKKEAVKAANEEKEKVRKAARSTKDDRNAVVIQLATHAVDNAATRKQVQNLTEEIKHLESQKRQLQDKARAQVKASKKATSSMLAPSPTSPRNMPSLVPVDSQTSLHFASSISPTTALQNLSIRPAIQTKSLPVRNVAPSLSPLLMPPPGLKPPRSTVRPVRPVTCSTQTASSTYLGDIGALLHTSSSLQSPVREPATPSTSTGIHTSPGVLRKMPRIELSPVPKIPCRYLPSHTDERAKSSPMARVASVPDYQRIPHTVTQTPATHPHAAAEAALPFEKPMSAAVIRGKGSVPGPSTTGNHQQRPFRVRFPCADLLEKRQSDTPLEPEQMSIRVISQDTESLASQSPTPSSACNSSAVQFLEREDTARPSEVLGGGESPAQSESSINAFGPKPSPGDTTFNLFDEDDNSGGDSFFFNMDGIGGTTPRFTF